MVLHDGSTVYADTATEVLEEMLPGYGSLDEAAQFGARTRHARRVAEFIQRLQIDRAVAAGLFDEADPQLAALVHILTTDKALSLTLELPDAPGEVADWLPVVPLVLLTTSYAPHTQYPRIGGNVVWLDPASEASYLAGLHRTGIFNYWTSMSPLLADEAGGEPSSPTL